MIITYILIVFFYVSLFVVAFILARKIFKVDKNLSVAYNHDVHYIVSSYTKKILRKTFKETFKFSEIFFKIAIIKTKPVAYNLKKIFLRYYKDFFDSVNGKNEIKKKGASSFFLKTIAQYKKEFKKTK